MRPDAIVEVIFREESDNPFIAQEFKGLPFNRGEPIHEWKKAFNVIYVGMGEENNF